MEIRRLDHRFRGVFVSTRPQLVPSRPFPYLRHSRFLGSGCDGYEVEGLLLSDPGEDGVDDPGVVFAVAGEEVAVLDRTAAAAAAGLQCAQIKILKPRPSQLVQIAPLKSVSRWDVTQVEEWGDTMYLGAFPAQCRHVKTVRPPMQEMWSGSRL